MSKAAVGKKITAFRVAIFLCYELFTYQLNIRDAHKTVQNAHENVHMNFFEILHYIYLNISKHTNILISQIK